MSDYSALKTQMETRRQALQHKIERIKADVSKAHSADWSEQAQERENDEVLNSLGSEAEHEVAEINAALVRMENGEYGKCLSCGVEIPMARLQLRPEDPNCVKCAD